MARQRVEASQARTRGVIQGRRAGLESGALIARGERLRSKSVKPHQCDRGGLYEVDLRSYRDGYRDAAREIEDKLLKLKLTCDPSALVESIAQELVSVQPMTGVTPEALAAVGDWIDKSKARRRAARGISC